MGASYHEAMLPHPPGFLKPVLQVLLGNPVSAQLPASFPIACSPRPVGFQKLLLLGCVSSSSGDPKELDGVLPGSSSLSGSL